MSETEQVVAAMNRLAQAFEVMGKAFERYTDAYLDVNLPEDEAEDRPTQSLSDRG